MKMCFCRFLFAAAIIVIALAFWTASWAKILIVILAALLAVMSLFYRTCCCANLKTKKAE